jgi:hypothetical protein
VVLSLLLRCTLLPLLPLLPWRCMRMCWGTLLGCLLVLTKVLPGCC